MKKLIIAFIFTLSASSTHAAPMKILFFYPGGQGDQQAAQPILDAFSEALKRNSAGKVEAQVFYISDPQAGLQFIKTQKPQAAILSLDTFYRYGNELGAKVIAKSLQLPSGDGTDQYFIVGKSGTTLPTAGPITLLSPRLLDSSFVAGKLFPNLSGVQWKIEASPNAVGALRAIGNGTKEGFVLLDQFEYANISKLKTPWAQALTPLASSQKISGAPVVVFSQNLSPELAAELEKSLLKLSQDAASRETLTTLRITGFKAARGADENG
jgi:hypothetical protein